MNTRKLHKKMYVHEPLAAQPVLVDVVENIKNKKLKNTVTTQILILYISKVFLTFHPLTRDYLIIRIT